MRWFFTICLLVTGLHGSPGAHADGVAELLAGAEQGNADDQLALGVMYQTRIQTGQGVVQDYKQALFWYRKAADQGDAHAQSNLGFMYFQSQGVIRNHVQAHKWLNLVAANSTGEVFEHAAGGRSLIEEMMTPQQVAEAQRLAGEWQVRQP